ncbi:MAG: M24 family metallopeptidase [Acutalibacteraceae bacterium]
MNDIPQLKNNNSAWIMYSAENCDPYFKKFISSKTIVPAISIITGSENFLIVHSLDYENVKNFNGKIKLYTGESSLIENITSTLEKLNFPNKLFFNFSDKRDSQTDIIGYGTFRFLKDNITAFYNKFGCPTPTFNSADEIIYSLMDKKSDEDIKYLKIAANRALEILNMTFRKIRIGMTEKQISFLTHKIFEKKPFYFKKYGIIKEEFSWEKDLCPVVLVGPNLKKGGHSAAGNTVLKPGYTIYFDFGVKIHTKNGKKYSSDIQRMGYALRQNEKSAPENIKKVFDTLVSAIKIGIDNLKPCKCGSDIDQLVRNYIIENGYPDYNHATGHPVGEDAHSPGTSLSPRGHKRSEMMLQENGVYTIEPRVQIENGGSIEEMVQVTKNGGVALCPPQKQLYLIR